jgi:hypothetical protein
MSGLVAPNNIAFIEDVLKYALGSGNGPIRIARVMESQIEEANSNRFNSERALEVYRAAIDKLFWSCIRELPARRGLYRSYIQSGLRDERAARLTSEFMTTFAIKNQRPPRRYLGWLFFGA